MTINVQSMRRLGAAAIALEQQEELDYSQRKVNEAREFAERRLPREAWAATGIKWSDVPVHADRDQHAILVGKGRADGFEFEAHYDIGVACTLTITSLADFQKHDTVKLQINADDISFAQNP